MLNTEAASGALELSTDPAWSTKPGDSPDGGWVATAVCPSVTESEVTATPHAASSYPGSRSGNSMAADGVLENARNTTTATYPTEHDDSTPW